MFKLTYVCVCVCVCVYIYIYIYICRTSQVALVLKNLPANAGDVKRHGFNPWAGEIPWSGAWQPTPIFLPAESHGQRNLVGYNPWDHKELDTTEALSTHIYLCIHIYMLNFLYFKIFK